jgi:hypothetical protein
MSVGVMEDYKLRDLRASHTLVGWNENCEKKKKKETEKKEIEMTGVGFSISGSAAPTTERRAVTANSSSAKRQSSAGQADEIALGSCLPAGLSDVELENICRLQYARWKDVQEYVAAVGSMPDVWPESGLFKVRFPSQSRFCDGFSFAGQFIAAEWLGDDNQWTCSHARVRSVDSEVVVFQRSVGCCLL